ncbi:tetratricopeptide repeat protein [Clostridium oryzae]|uniref:Uncharacterized protein n=1 Tax=Clostridium oryzae TaxID=1450648 RepID=A0A1V4IRX0_9CLOT|nr:tetratricopeptide repeat protein [Clostridium oryzae]OPJ62555.1 hypothetical protein CLORY_16850 [Clostridium oryzae]
MYSEREALMKLEKEKLVDIVIELLGRLEKIEKNKFISKNIDSQLALDNMNENKDEKYLEKIRVFCKECLEGNYYIEDTNYYGAYGEDSFERCEWAVEFSQYFNITLMHARNKEYTTALQSFELLFNCICEAREDIDILGTEYVDYYIEVDWTDVFEQYYICVKNCILDRLEMVEKALEIWRKNGKQYSSVFINLIGETELVEKAIRSTIENEDLDWEQQHAYFGLLRDLKEKYEPEANKIKLAESFLTYSVNFNDDLSEEYFEAGRFQEAAVVIKEAVEKITDYRIVANMKIRLVSCYESLEKFDDAFEVMDKLFKERPSYEYYIKTRHFAGKTNGLCSFIDDTLSFLETSKVYDANTIRLKILSYEGQLEKLMDFMNTYSGTSRYDYEKYTSKALIYHAFQGKNVEYTNLKEFLKDIESSNEEGITDIDLNNQKQMKPEHYLIFAVELLKEMVTFHIEACTRSRYVRAAYYCSTAKDILSYLGKENEFFTYYLDIMSLNRRKTALKDEMEKRIGKVELNGKFL